MLGVSDRVWGLCGEEEQCASIRGNTALWGTWVLLLGGIHCNNTGIMGMGAAIRSIMVLRGLLKGVGDKGAATRRNTVDRTPIRDAKEQRCCY